MQVFEQASVFFHRHRIVRTIPGKVCVTDALSAVFNLSPKTSARALYELIKCCPDLEDHLLFARIKHGTPFLVADYMTFLYITERIHYKTNGFMPFMDHLFHTIVYPAPTTKSMQHACL